MNEEKGYLARLEYELNCIAKYDRPGRPSLPIPKREQMRAFAIKHNTTEEEMIYWLPVVEKELKKRGLD